MPSSALPGNGVSQSISVFRPHAVSPWAPGRGGVPQRCILVILQGAQVCSGFRPQRTVCFEGVFQMMRAGTSPSVPPRFKHAIQRCHCQILRLFTIFITCLLNHTTIILLLPLKLQFSPSCCTAQVSANNVGLCVCNANHSSPRTAPCNCQH